MTEMKQITKQQAVEELKKLTASTSGKVCLRAFKHLGVEYCPIEQETAVSLLGEKIVFAFTKNYEKVIKFFPYPNGE